MERTKCVKCLGVMLGDGLSWREQAQHVRKKCSIGLAKLRKLRNILPSSRTKSSSAMLWYITPPRLLLSGVRE